MKISRFLFAAFFIAVSLLPATSRAETRSGAFTLSPMIGGIVMEGDQQVDDDVAYSFGIGYNLTEAFALEASLAYAELDEENSNDEVDFWNYRIDALYHFMTGRSLAPYVAAGVGGYDLDSDTEFMANYGLGLLYFLTDDIALRADVRHLAAFNESNLENNLLYTAGLKFQFGGREEFVAPAAAEPAPSMAMGMALPTISTSARKPPKARRLTPGAVPSTATATGSPTILIDVRIPPKVRRLTPGAVPSTATATGSPTILIDARTLPKARRSTPGAAPSTATATVFPTTSIDVLTPRRESLSTTRVAN